MKRTLLFSMVLLAGLFVVGGCSVQEAEAYDSTKQIMNKVLVNDEALAVSLSPELSDSVSLSVELTDTNDTFTYGSGDTNRYCDLSKYRKAKVEIEITGTTPSYDVTPYYGNSDLEVYMKGTSYTITDDTILFVDVYGEDRFALFFDNKSGTNPHIEAKVTGVN